MPGNRHARYRPLVLLAALIAIGIAAHFVDAAAWREALEWTRSYATQWWLPVALIALQTLLFAFGLPGSSVLWLVAPLYTPAIATVILTVGGCLGSLAAYGFARKLTGASLARLSASRGWRMLERESDFFALCALRLTPGFPHAVLNYAAGILRVRLGPFLAAAAIGFGLKAFVYSSVIYRTLDAADSADVLEPWTWVPLAGLAALMLLGWALRRRPSRRSTHA